MKKVQDLMTKQVVAVGEDAGFKEMVRLLEKHRVSALPVIDSQGKVVGVVSEADLLLKEGLADLESKHVFESSARRAARVKARGGTARETMTSPAIAVGPDASVEEAARRMHAMGVKRLPVAGEDGRLVGILSRSDVLKVFLRQGEEIRREIVEELISRTLLIDPSTIDVTVRDGVVTLTGQVDRKTDAVILSRMVTRVSGVVSAISHLSFRYDDTRPARSEPSWVGRP